MTENRDPASETLPLFDHGHHAHQTRRDAFAASLGKAPSRTIATLQALADAGDPGRTRNELASDIGCAPSSICAIALDLLREQLAIENGERRKTPYNATAAVMVITPAGREALGIGQ